MKQPEVAAVRHLNQLLPISTSGSETQYDHSAHIIDFIKAVVEDTRLRNVESEANEVLSSLRNLLQTLKKPNTASDPCCTLGKGAAYQSDPIMPPVDSVVAVLRWAKGLLLLSNTCQFLNELTKVFGPRE